MREIQFSHLNNPLAVGLQPTREPEGTQQAAPVNQTARPAGENTPAITRPISNKAKILAIDETINTNTDTLNSIVKKAGINVDDLVTALSDVWVDGPEDNENKKALLKKSLDALLLSDETAFRLRRADSKAFSETEITTLKNAALELAKRVNGGIIDEKYISIAANGGTEFDLSKPDVMAGLLKKTLVNLRKKSLDDQWRNDYEKFAEIANERAADLIRKSDDIRTILEALKLYSTLEGDVAEKAKRYLTMLSCGDPKNLMNDAGVNFVYAAANPRDFLLSLKTFLVESIPGGIRDYNEELHNRLTTVADKIGTDDQGDIEESVKQIVQLMADKTSLYRLGKSISAEYDTALQPLKNAEFQNIPDNDEGRSTLITKVNSALKTATAKFGDVMKSAALSRKVQDFQALADTLFQGVDIQRNTDHQERQNVATEFKNITRYVKTQLDGVAAASLKKKIVDAQKEAMRDMNDKSGTSSIAVSIRAEAEFAVLLGFASAGATLDIVFSAAIPYAHGAVIGGRNIHIAFSGGGGVKQLFNSKPGIFHFGDSQNAQQALIKATGTLGGGKTMTTLYPDLDAYLNDCSNGVLKLLFTKKGLSGVKSYNTGMRMASIANVQFNEKLRELGVLGRFDTLQQEQINKRIFTKIGKHKVDGAIEGSSTPTPLSSFNLKASVQAAHTWIDTKKYSPIATQLRENLTGGGTLNTVFKKYSGYIKSSDGTGNNVWTLNDLMTQENLINQALSSTQEGTPNVALQNIRNDLAGRITELRKELERFAEAAAKNDAGEKNTVESQLKAARGHRTRGGYMREMAITYAALAGLYTKTNPHNTIAENDREALVLDAKTQAEIGVLDKFLSDPPIWMSLTKARSSILSSFSSRLYLRKSLYVTNRTLRREYSFSFGGKITLPQLLSDAKSGLSSRTNTIEFTVKGATPTDKKSTTHYKPNDVASLAVNVKIPYGVTAEIVEEYLKSILNFHKENPDAGKSEWAKAAGKGFLPAGGTAIKEAASYVAQYLTTMGTSKIPLPGNMRMPTVVKRSSNLDITLNFYADATGDLHFGTFLVGEDKSSTATVSFSAGKLPVAATTASVSASATIKKTSSVYFYERVSSTSLTPYLIRLANLGPPSHPGWKYFVANNYSSCLELLKNINEGSLQAEMRVYENIQLRPEQANVRTNFTRACEECRNLVRQRELDIDLVAEKLGNLLVSMMTLDEVAAMNRRLGNGNG